MRVLGWVFVGACLMGCGGGPVPTLTAADLTSPAMQGLKPRTMAIEVSDGRPVSAEDQQTTEDEVTQALGQAFGRQGVKVIAESPNVLSVTLRYPAKRVNDIDPESCVEMLGELKLADGRSMNATTLGCAEFKNALGMSYGSRVSGAFQYAADTLLKYLDETYAGANTPLTFESAKIKVPPFPEVGVSSLHLTVKDEYSEGGSLGQNLHKELVAAFAAARVKVDEKAPQTMVLTLSHPTEDFAGRDKSTCVAIEIKSRFKAGTAFGHGTSCRGIVETAQNKVLSEALQALWTEYAGLLGK